MTDVYTRLDELTPDEALDALPEALAAYRSRDGIDLRSALYQPEFMRLVARAAILSVPADAQAVGGIEGGGLPFAIALSMESYYSPQAPKLRWFAIRAEKKDHGADKGLVGNLENVTGALVVDDVINTGETASARMRDVAEQTRIEPLSLLTIASTKDVREGFISVDNYDVVPYSALVTLDQVVRHG